MLYLEDIEREIKDTQKERHVALKQNERNAEAKTNDGRCRK